MSAVTIIMLAIFGSMNIMNYYHLRRNADDMLTLIAENNGTVPEYPLKESDNRRLLDQLSQESPYQTRFFIVQYNTYDRVIDINTSHIAAVSDSEAEEFAEEVLATKKESGYKGIYRYKYTDTDFGHIVIFLDCSIQLKGALSMFITSCVIAIACIAAIFLIIFIFSSRFIRPMIDNIEKQKRFITDAGHELKTPLAIINANVEVIEMINGSNEWLDSIKNQVQRLDQLVKSMLQMAKMEEGTLSPVFSDFDLSNAFNEITNPFKTMAQQKGKKLSIHAQQNIHMSGDEGAIRNLISILVDNAIKYSNDGGRIEASLKRDGKFIKIKVRNSSDVKKNENLNLLFERFYRRDTSRSRESGGFGIGLSMAKTIVDSHKGKITAQTENGGYVSFNVTFKGISSPPLLKNKNTAKQSDS
jgi:sensor histidine kinase YesM